MRPASKVANMTARLEPIVSVIAAEGAHDGE